LKLGNFLHLSDIDPKCSSIKRLIDRIQAKSAMRIDLSAEEILVIEELLNRMLEISPERRASASDLLQHRWFRSCVDPFGKI
jgi:serine/threonine protein kinase